MLTLLLGYLFLGCMFYVEHRYESAWRTTTAIQTSGDDQGTWRLLVVIWLFCLTVNPLVWLVILQVGEAPTWLGWVGLGWILGGIVLLRWTLYVNPFYLRAMATTDDHFICTDGPYKVVRHPGYAAFIVAWLGFGLATANWYAFLTVTVLVVYSYVRRAFAEEQMMLDRFSVDYQHYMNETFR